MKRFVLSALLLSVFAGLIGCSKTTDYIYNVRGDGAYRINLNSYLIDTLNAVSIISSFDTVTSVDCVIDLTKLYDSLELNQDCIINNSNNPYKMGFRSISDTNISGVSGSIYTDSRSYSGIPGYIVNFKLWLHVNFTIKNIEKYSLSDLKHIVSDLYACVLIQKPISIY